MNWWVWTFGVQGGMLGGGYAFEETEGWGWGSALQKQRMSPKPLPHSLFCFPLLIQLCDCRGWRHGEREGPMNFKNNIIKHVWKDDHIASQWKTLIVSRDRLCSVIAAVRDWHVKKALPNFFKSQRKIKVAHIYVQYIHARTRTHTVLHRKIWGRWAFSIFQMDHSMDQCTDRSKDNKDLW